MAKPQPHTGANNDRRKLPKLPPNARVTKRPIHHPALPSPYAGASQQKVVYISTKTPFLSAVKRVEKLLRLSDKRLVQAAAAHAKQNARGGKRKREEDELVDVAREVERLKRVKGSVDRRGDREDEGAGPAGEEVVMKGTGKAIEKVLQLALWFQQRHEEYVVRMRTGTVGAIDDVELMEEERGGVAVREDDETAEETNCGDWGTIEGAEGHSTVEPDSDVVTEGQKPLERPKSEDGNVNAHKRVEKKSKTKTITSSSGTSPDEPVPETRIRYTSVLEVAVSLR